jgi:DNA-binding transcriptional LysR family regulator
MQDMASWSDVRYFLEVYRRGSLSGAARVLDVDQTTVGRRLKALERDVGARLLRTTVTGASLTDAGRAILPEAEEMEHTMEALRRKAAARSSAITGVVTIATTEALASTFLVPRLAELRANHPAMDFVVATGNRTLDLARGDADLALRLVRPVEPELIARRVGDITLGVYAASSYLAMRGTPNRAADLADHDVLGYHGELAGGTEARWLAAHAARARVVLRANSVLNVLAAAVAGIGVAILPHGLGTVEPALRRLELQPEPDKRGVWVVFHQDARANARVKAIVDDLIATARDPDRFPRRFK